jgi:hypothetical protein
VIIVYLIVFGFTFWFLSRLWRWLMYLAGLRRCFWRSIPCPGCRADISAVGVFRCRSCGYTDAGWYFARCRMCGETPAYLRCDCGLCVRNPLLR